MSDLLPLTAVVQNTSEKVTLINLETTLRSRGEAGWTLVQALPERVYSSGPSAGEDGYRLFFTRTIRR